uniref:SPRY domain-containing SOCS box protein 3 n=1 Tax=Trichuris muris TaxID=70415 RepID=A0A5S6R4E4_TRIMR
MRICQCLRTKKSYLGESNFCPFSDSCDDNWTWDTPEETTTSVHTYGQNGRTVLFHSNWSNGTVAIRGNRPLPKHGQYYWEIDVSHRVFGTSLMFGVGTAKASLHETRFVNLIGQDGHSWGLSHKGQIWHDGKGRQFTDPFIEYTPTTIGLLYNGSNGTLSYYKDGRSLGVAFDGLNAVEEPLFPMISSTAARTEMTLNETKRTFWNLQDRCCWRLVQVLESIDQVDRLPLPTPVRIELKRRSRWTLRL